jgi:hypothetical protein
MPQWRRRNVTEQTFVTVNPGGPDIPDGVYLVQLTKVSDPKTVTAQRGPKAGEDVDLIDWTFTIDQPGSEVHDKELEASTSTSSGPRSKMYAWLTALFGGVAPIVGASFKKSDLIGRYALATTRKDDSGWPRIENLGAAPAALLAQRIGAATGTPVQANGAPAPAAAGSAPLRETVAAGAVDDLPF